MKFLPLPLAAISVATLVLVGSVPVHAQPAAKDPDPTVLRVTLPRTTEWSSTLRLPGDLMVKKSRGDKSLGKESLTDAVSTITRWAQDGRSVLGIVKINGKTRETKGLPVVMSDGMVKIRLAQARGSRAVTLTRSSSSSATWMTCPRPTVAMTSQSGMTICSSPDGGITPLPPKPPEPPPPPE